MNGKRSHRIKELAATIPLVVCVIAMAVNITVAFTEIDLAGEWLGPDDEVYTIRDVGGQWVFSRSDGSPGVVTLEGAEVTFSWSDDEGVQIHAAGKLDGFEGGQPTLIHLTVGSGIVQLARKGGDAMPASAAGAIAAAPPPDADHDTPTEDPPKRKGKKFKDRILAALADYAERELLDEDDDKSDFPLPIPAGSLAGRWENERGVPFSFEARGDGYVWKDLKTGIHGDLVVNGEVLTFSWKDAGGKTITSQGRVAASDSTGRPSQIQCPRQLLTRTADVAVPVMQPLNVANVAVDPKMSGCMAYAKSAVAQNEENRKRNCGLAGPSWSSNLDYHYKWCAHGENSRRAEREKRTREQQLAQCR